MTRRKLTREEVDLWRKVVRQADRLHPERMDSTHPKPLPKPNPAKPLPMSLDPFEIGQSARARPQRHVLSPSITDRLGHAPVQMDAKVYTRMRRGKLKPEGKLDLHGMRVDTAHPALVRFILASQAQGRRLVLVVTGKGKDRDDPGPIPTPRGVLRHQVPQWLSLPPLAQAVLQVTPAHVSHGGEGAYYVYIRRARN